MMLFVTISFGILLIHFLLVYIFNGFTSACSLLIYVTCPYDRPQCLLVITSYDKVILVLFGWFSSCQVVCLWMFFFFFLLSWCLIIAIQVEALSLLYWSLASC